MPNITKQTLGVVLTPGTEFDDTLAALREAFVQQYSCNLLGEFRDELSMQVQPPEGSDV